jgi:predicted dithiol-disulfide oxidoreductase (DUF899 family)
MKHRTVSRDEWLAARRRLLAQEKELTHARDRLSAARRELPWVKVEKPYVFEGPRGKETLADLFRGRSQLVVYHFMFGPGWEQGCPSCSYLSDHVDGALVHLAHRDVTWVAVSRAPYPQIAAFRQRMGWRFEWVSSHGTDFNFDFAVSFTEEDRARGKVRYNYEEQDFAVEELPGLSVFHRDAAGEVFHTYSAYARGLDMLVNTYNILDLVPKGRDETGLPHTMAWVRHHDRYEDGETGADPDARGGARAAVTVAGDRTAAAARDLPEQHA